MVEDRDLNEHPLRIEEFDAAAAIIAGSLAPTAQICWPLLGERAGCEVWVKHENHLPTGAFKVRGGVWFVHLLMQSAPPSGIIAATRGNHGQSIAFACRSHSLPCVIVVPEGNNPEKNRAMEALGAELIVSGRDFDQALDTARTIADGRGLLAMPSYHWRLVQGVGTYAMEFFRNTPPLDAVYVPIGLGSGLSGVIAARNALGLHCEVIGVVASGADAYALSFERGQAVPTDCANTMADGMAVRVPSEEALAFMLPNVARVVRVNEDEILDAIRFYYTDTHNLAEGAGAAPLAALIKERERHRGRRVGLILSGANLDVGSLRRVFES